MLSQITLLHQLLKISFFLLWVLTPLFLPRVNQWITYFVHFYAILSLTRVQISYARKRDLTSVVSSFDLYRFWSTKFRQAAAGKPVALFSSVNKNIFYFGFGFFLTFSCTSSLLIGDTAVRMRNCCVAWRNEHRISPNISPDLLCVEHVLSLNFWKIPFFYWRKKLVLTMKQS